MRLLLITCLSLAVLESAVPGEAPPVPASPVLSAPPKADTGLVRECLVFDDVGDAEAEMKDGDGPILSAGGTEPACGSDCDGPNCPTCRRPVPILGVPAGVEAGSGGAVFRIFGEPAPLPVVPPGVARISDQPPPLVPHALPPILPHPIAMPVPTRVPHAARSACAAHDESAIADGECVCAGDSKTRRITTVHRIRFVPARTVAEQINSNLKREQKLCPSADGVVIDSPVVVVPEEATNSLIVSATAGFHKQVAKIIAETDKAGHPVQVRLRLTRRTKAGKERVVAAPVIVTQTGRPARVEVSTDEGIFRMEIVVRSHGKPEKRASAARPRKADITIRQHCSEASAPHQKTKAHVTRSPAASSPAVPVLSKVPYVERLFVQRVGGIAADAAPSARECAACRAGCSKLETRVHAVADLLCAKDRASSGEALVRLVRQFVEPKSWRDGGGAGTIAFFEGTCSLVVRHQEGVHDQIADLLQHLRSVLPGSQVVSDAKGDCRGGGKCSCTSAAMSSSD